MVNLKKLGFVTAGALMLFAVGATMTACGGAPGKVKAESIVYDGLKISWGEVKNAEKYIVYINDVPKTVSGTSINYKAKASETEVVVSVSGLSAKEKEGKKSTRTFTRLETISESTITFDEAGVMSWGDIDGADSYLLSINGEETQVSSATYSEFPTGKSLNIKVRPYTTDGLTFSDWSKTYTKTYLSQVENIKYDGEKLTWKGANYAQKYELLIDGGEPIEISGKAYDYDAKQQTFSVQIKAKSSDPNVYDSVMTDEKEFIFLPVIEDLRVADGQLAWDEVSAAESYDVQINGGMVQNVQGTSIPLEAGKSLSIKVKPVTSGEVYFSDWSVAKPAYVLESPELQWFNSASLENGEEVRAISWSQVNGSVDGYQVTIESPDGSKASSAYGVNQRDIMHAFATAGTYTITVQATTEHTDVYASAPSAPIIVERLASPSLKKQNPIVSDPTNNNQFRVTWNPVSFANDYRIYQGGSVLTGVDIADYTAVITNPIPTEATGETTQVYMIQTRGAGLEQLGDGVQRVRLSSIIPTEGGNNPDTCSFSITSMAMPTGLSCAGQTMSWEGDAQEYAVRGIGSDKPFNTTIKTFDLYTLNDGRFYPSVCAKGDGASVLASNYTASITVERLQYPINIGITSYQADLPCVSWDEVDHATGYDMTVNASEQVQDVNSGDAIAQEFITTAGVSIGLTSTANEWEDNVYWVTSKESPVKNFIKLATPTFNKQLVRDGALRWNAPGNAQSVSSPFTYSIYNASYTTVKASLTTPSVTLEALQLSAGDHVFFVKCIGDKDCINSDYSEQISFSILEAPEIVQAETAYKWEPVIGANSYEVLVNGEVVKTVPYAENPDTDYYTYVPDKFVLVGVDYTVQIRAIGDDGYTTVNSEYYTITQRTARLDSPSFSLSYLVDGQPSAMYNKNGYVVSTITEAVPNAKAYEFKLMGHSSGEVSELSYQRMSTSTGAFKASVRAIGGTFDLEDENKTYYITSLDAEEKEIVLYAPVQNIEKTTQGKVTWILTDAKCPPQVGYTIKLCYNDGTVVEDTIRSGFSYTVGENPNNVQRIEIVINSRFEEVEGVLQNMDPEGDLIIGSEVGSKDFIV